jgi:uncharacterized protein involved in outer membrane biogenesis
MKKAVKVVGISALVCLLLLAGGVVTMMLLFPSEKIKALIIPQIEKSIGRKVVLQKAGFSFYPVLGISLTGIEISNTERQGFSSEPFVKVDNLLVQIPVMSLIKKQPEISAIILKQPQILIEVDTMGAFNYDDMAMMAKSETTKSEEPKVGKKSQMPLIPVPVTLKKFVIENGNVTFSDKKSGSEYSVDDIDQTIGFSIDKQLKDIKTSGNLVLSDVSVKTKDFRKPLSNLTVTLAYDIGADLTQGTANIKKMRLSFQKVFFDLTGTISGLLDIPQFDLTLDTDPISIGDLLSEIPVELAPDLAKLTASGTADLNVLVKGAFESGKPLPIKGTLSFNNGMVKYKDLPKSIRDITTEIGFTDNSLDIKEMKFLFGENPVELKATVVNFKRPIMDLALKARISLDDIKDLMELPSGASVAGIIDLSVRAKGEADAADPSKLDMQGTADLKDVAVKWPPLVIPAVVNGEFSLSSKAIAENLSVVIGKSSLKMSAGINNYLSLIFDDKTRSLPRPNADFKMTSKLLDIDEFMPPAKETASTGGASPSTGTSTQSTANLPLIAPLPGVDLKGSIIAQKIIYQGVTMDNMNLNVNVRNDIADLTVKTGFSGGTITDVVHADLRNVNNVNFTNQLTITGVEVNEFLAKFGNFIQPTNALNRELKNLQNNLYGKMNLTSNIAGQGGTSEAVTKSLKGTIDARLSNGKIAKSLIVARMAGILEKFMSFDDITFRDFKAKLSIANENVSFDECKLESDLAGDWSVGGNVGFDAGLDMAIDNKMTKGASSKVLSVQNSGKSALKGILKGTQFEAAAGLIENTGIPTDADGRITLKIALKGTATDPKPSFIGFGKGSGTGAPSPQPTVKEQLNDKVQETIQENRAQIEQKITEEGKKLEEEIIKNTNINKAQEEQLKKGIGKLKKLF